MAEKGLLSPIAFSGFGPSSLAADAGAFANAMLPAPRSEGFRKELRRACPNHPGVYAMLDAGGAILYVGKSKQLRSRLLSYLRATGFEEKAARILEHAEAIAWEEQPSEFAALLRELELIRRWRPRYNVRGRPGRRGWTFLCVGHRPAPYAYLSRQASPAAVATFGPIPDRQRAREAARRLNDYFRLRDCPDRQKVSFSEQGQLFEILESPGCLRLEVGVCLGTCVGATSRRAYDQQARAALRFLEGKDDSPIVALAQKMAEASDEWNFESAAACRDALEPLHWLRDHLARLRQARIDRSFVYPDGPDLWRLFVNGQHVKTIPAPKCRGSARRAQAALAKAYQASATPHASDVEDVEQLFLIESWFRLRPEDLERTIAPDVARRRCSELLAS